MLTYNEITTLVKKNFMLYCISIILTIYNLFDLLISSLISDVTFCNKLVIYPSIRDFVSLVVIITLIVQISWKYQRTNTQPITGRLQKRIVVTFSLIAAIPVIILTVFFLLFLSMCSQKWINRYTNQHLYDYDLFNKAYLEKGVNNLKKISIAIANDLANASNKLWTYNKTQFNDILRGYKNAKLIDDAVVFDANTKIVIAKSSDYTLLNRSSFESLINDLGQYEIVKVNGDQVKSSITRIPGYSGIYLATSKIADQSTLDYIGNNSLSQKTYNYLKNQILCLQLKFLITFLYSALLLVLISIHIGFIIANKIFNPIKELVNATETVKLGNLKAQLAQTNTGDELDILTAAFNHMIRQLDYQSKDLAIAQRALAWSDVARRVAHEINNPLTPIQLSANMLEVKFAREVQDSSTFSKYVDTILRHTEDIKKIVKEFTNFAKIPTPTFVKCDLVTIIRESIESRQIINDKVEYKFITELVELDFVADITQINQIIINLVKNSEEALETKEVKRKVITILLQKRSPDTIIIEIQDTGSGFPPNLINYITEPYVTTRSRGSGLGLAIVKKIVEDHFGILKIRNLPSGTGASVKIVFDYHKLQTVFQSGKK